MLQFTGKIFPAAIQRRLVILDRLETWRAFHLTLGMLALLPLSWHVTTVAMSPLEAVLATLVVLLFISGIFGAILQDRLPRSMMRLAEHEVRLEDVDSKVNAVYREAEEKILGHDEQTDQGIHRSHQAYASERSIRVAMDAVDGDGKGNRSRAASVRGGGRKDCRIGRREDLSGTAGAGCP